MNTRQFEDAHNMAVGYAANITAADVTPIFVVQYVPALGTGGAAATIALVQDGDMTFLVDGAAPAGLDAIGTAGVIDTSAAAFDTLGELADYINGRTSWRCYLAAGLRIDDCAGILAKSAASAFGDTGLSFYNDTSTNVSTAVPGTAGTLEVVGSVISAERFVNNGVNGHQKDFDEGVENMLLHAAVTQAFTGAGLLQVFSGKQGATETILFSNALATTVEQDLGRTGTVQIDGLAAVFLKATRGERLIVRASAATTFTGHTKFEVFGKSAVLSGAHMSASLNY